MGQDEVYAADALLELGPAPPLPNKAELAAAGGLPPPPGPGAAAAAGGPPPQQQQYVPFNYPTPSSGAAMMPPYPYPSASRAQPPLPGKGEGAC